MSNWMDKLWTNSLPEKLLEQVNRINYPIQANDRTDSHWFYYNKDKINADIGKWWEFKKIMILINFIWKNKLNFYIASLKDDWSHWTAKKWPYHSLVPKVSTVLHWRSCHINLFGRSSRCNKQWDAYLLVGNHKVTWENICFFALKEEKHPHDISACMVLDLLGLITVWCDGDVIMKITPVLSAAHSCPCHGGFGEKGIHVLLFLCGFSAFLFSAGLSVNRKGFGLGFSCMRSHLFFHAAIEIILPRKQSLDWNASRLTSDLHLQNWLPLLIKQIPHHISVPQSKGLYSVSGATYGISEWVWACACQY